MKITKCSSIDDMIDYGKTLTISHDKLYLKNKIIDSEGNTTIFNYSSLLDKYIDNLKPYIVDITLTDEEYKKYMYQPKTLSFELYNTTELWSIILKINNILSISEFNLKKLKLFTMDIFKVINEILILEEENIKTNKNENSI